MNCESCESSVSPGTDGRYVCPKCGWCGTGEADEVAAAGDESAKSAKAPHRKRRWSYTVATIAKTVNKQPWQVRRAVRLGEFDPGELESVAKYVMKNWLDGEE